jgi:hypothetical protein
VEGVDSCEDGLKWVFAVGGVDVVDIDLRLVSESALGILTGSDQVTTTIGTTCQPIT